MDDRICTAPAKGGMAWVSYTRLCQIVDDYDIQPQCFKEPYSFADKSGIIGTYTRRRLHVMSLGQSPNRIDVFLSSLKEVPFNLVGSKSLTIHKFKLTLVVSEKNEFAGYIQVFRNSEDEYKY